MGCSIQSFFEISELMPHIGLPTDDLEETHSLQKSCRRSEFCPIPLVRFVEYNEPMVVLDLIKCPFRLFRSFRFAEYNKPYSAFPTQNANDRDC